jgi:ATP adenylyltransferase
METLFTPWRQRYIADQEVRTGCFFCVAAAAPADADTLVVHGGRHHIVMLNLHPYTGGHLMVAPREHVADLEGSSREARAEIWDLVLLAQAALRQTHRPHGFNVGMNLGRSAGAGVPDHYHLHLVPRWDGDTNFMAVIGETRVIPEDLRQTRDRQRAVFQEMAS